MADWVRDEDDQDANGREVECDPRTAKLAGSSGFVRLLGKRAK